MRTVHEVRQRTSSVRADCQAGCWALAAGLLLCPDCAVPDLVCLHLHVQMGGDLLMLHGVVRQVQPASAHKRCDPA